MGNADYILEDLRTSVIGHSVVHLMETDSTNSFAKKFAKMLVDDSYVVITEFQTAGKGRNGRSFYSMSDKGLWMSLVLKPNIELSRFPQIAQIAAAAVYKGLKNIGITTEIKWPNDIMIGGKKVCGILTEMSFDGLQSSYAIPGIGLNVNFNPEDFPDDIKDIATSLKIEYDEEFDKRQIAAEILNAFEELYDAFISGDFSATVDICKQNSCLLGKKILVTKDFKANDQVEALVQDINENGELVVQMPNGLIECLFYGEVSIKIL